MEQPGAVIDRENLDDGLTTAVDDAVVAEDDLANSGIYFSDLAILSFTWA